ALMIGGAERIVRAGGVCMEGLGRRRRAVGGHVRISGLVHDGGSANWTGPSIGFDSTSAPPSLKSSHGKSCRRGGYREDTAASLATPTGFLRSSAFQAEPGNESFRDWCRRTSFESLITPHPTAQSSSPGLSRRRADRPGCRRRYRTGRPP